MLLSTASVSAAAIVAVGILVFWSNPHRKLNRSFLTMSLQTALWLTCVHLGVTGNEDAFWIRCASIVSAYGPAHLWVLKLIFVDDGKRRPASTYWPLVYLIASALALTVLSCTDWYVQAQGPGMQAKFGAGALLYIVLAVATYLLVLRDVLVEIRRSVGAVRLELQILLLGLSVACLVILALMAVRVVTRAIWPIHLQPIVLLLVYAATLVLVTTNRIFDARQISMWALEKLAVGLCGIGALLLTNALCGRTLAPDSVRLLIVVVVTVSAVVTVDRWLQKRFRFYPRAGEARRAILAASEREVRWDRLHNAFEAILRGWGQSERTVLLCGPRNILLNASESLRTGMILDAINELRWATPERLSRERPNLLNDTLAAFMRAEELGIMVLANHSTQIAIVGVGPSATRMPYTYPQAMELLEMASLMEGVFERVQLTAKVQHSEQLAMVGMVGASLAHEIRNPLVAIRTFVQMLPKQHQNPEFREKFFHVVDEEVQRIEKLARQFLDLSAPRQFTPMEIHLHSVITSGLELISPKAAQKGIILRCDLMAAHDAVVTDAAAAKQVLLNLCLNAIQALDGAKSEKREVLVRTRNLGPRVELTVTDSGPGIAPEVRGRLFEPFQTTRPSGFGLGLAVCSDVLTKLDATISVDPPAPGEGATFRVLFPASSGSRHADG